MIQFYGLSNIVTGPLLLGLQGNVRTAGGVRRLRCPCALIVNGRQISLLRWALAVRERGSSSMNPGGGGQTLELVHHLGHRGGGSLFTIIHCLYVTLVSYLDRYLHA